MSPPARLLPRRGAGNAAGTQRDHHPLQHRTSTAGRRARTRPAAGRCSSPTTLRNSAPSCPAMPTAAARDGEVLSRDHLPEDAARAFAAASSVGEMPDVVRRGHLHAAEQRVRRRVRARHGDAQPADHRREEREEGARPRRPEAERERLAGLVERRRRARARRSRPGSPASSWTSVAPATRSARIGASPMAAMVIRPDISMSVPAAGSQLKWNVRLRRASPSGLRTSRPGPLEARRPRRAGELALDRRQLRDREHRDDHEVGGVRAQHVARRVPGRVVAPRQRRRAAARPGDQTRRSATTAAMLDDRRDDVRQLDRDVVRARELGEREARARRHRRDGPRLPDPAPAVDDGDAG